MKQSNPYGDMWYCSNYGQNRVPYISDSIGNTSLIAGKP